MQLNSWLDNLPSKYQKNKNGLIDFVYDEFKSGRIPFD